MSEEIIRQRTDVLLSSLTGQDYDLESYLSKLEEVEATSFDTATVAVAIDPPAYSMRDLDKPMPPSKMVMPSDMQAFLAGHTKISTSYSGDWPEAEMDNKFGKHQPFDFESNSCPLLHGGAHGDPAYVDIVLKFIGEPMKTHREMERRIRPDLMAVLDNYGDPTESMFDLYSVDRNRYRELTDEGYMQQKKEELSGDYGLLSYLFGLEYQTGEQREVIMGLLSELSMSSEPNSPEARTVINKMQEKGGITFDRLLRNWRDRATPLKAWWSRPADKSGPTQPDMPNSPDRYHSSPWTEAGEKNHNYHWWEPYQYWGGVGRDLNSLKQVFMQSYSKIFTGSWLSNLLMDALPIIGKHMIAGSHYPGASNSPNGQQYADILSSDSQMNLDFERKRANWSGGSAHHHHLHPSEIEGQGSVMMIPHTAYTMSPFGRAMMNVGEHGAALAPFIGEEHPNSNPEFHDLHNQLNRYASNTMTFEAKRMANEVMEKFGIEVLRSKSEDDTKQFMNVEGNTIARGNIQQLLAAVNYRLMRNGDTAKFTEMPLPDTTTMKLIASNGYFEPLSPTARAVVPPIFNSGNTDAWGHLMPATLTWKYDSDTGDIEFNVTEQPFNIMQRTAHEEHIRAVDPAFHIKAIRSKQKEINLLERGARGFPALLTDLHKADDYELTGVFGKDLIKPAHIVKDLDDLETMKGFSGSWVVQKKPEGDRKLIKKEGKRLEPSMPKGISKDLKEMKGNFTLDAYLDGDKLSVVDLLVHKGTDLSFEPLEDRINVLKTLYHSTDNVHFPAPSNCSFSDHDGLVKAIAAFDKGEFLVRDASSTFIKDKELHPKWILFANDEISKSKVYPPLPEITINGSQLYLEYPEIVSVVKVDLGMDDEGTYIDGYEGLSYLVKQAISQQDLWIPPVAFLLKEAGGGGAAPASGGSGTVMSTDAGTYNPVHSVTRKKKKRRLKKAPAVNDEESDDIEHMMRRAVSAIEVGDESLTSDELCEKVKGLKHDHLLRFGGEYGIERTEDGKFTLNEAIDDDIVDTPIKKFKYPRMNAASADGGAWSGMQADITAPMGPTEINEEINTTFGDPRQGKDDEREEEDIAQLNIISEDIEKPEIEISEEEAIMRVPPKKKKSATEPQPSVRTDSIT